MKEEEDRNREEEKEATLEEVDEMLSHVPGINANLTAAAHELINDLYKQKQKKGTEP